MPKKSHSTSVAQLDKPAMKRVLRTSDLFAIGYGDLGSSIYYALGITALYALGATPIALILAGIIFVCTALTYAEMTSMFHESGGSASFARHAFNDLISFIAGWGLLLDYVVTIAISAFAVAPYLAYFFTPLKQTGVQIGFTIGLIALLFLLNVFGVKQSTRVSLALTSMTIGTQLIIIIITSFFLPELLQAFRARSIEWWPSWTDFWKGTAMAMVAYTGIESIAQLGAEAKRPSRTVPRAVFFTMITLMAMYLGISCIALLAITPHELSTQFLQDPIAGIVSALPVGSSMLAPLVGLLAAIILLVAANAGLMGASRLAFNMGEYYQIPRFFYKLQPRFRTPLFSLAFFAFIAAMVVLWSRGKMMFLADLYNFGAMIAFFSAHLALIVLRIKRPDLKRAVRIPLNIRLMGAEIPFTAILGCLGTFGVWVLIVVTKPEGRYLGCLWMGLGVAMYYFYRYKKKIAATGKLHIQKIKIPEFKPLAIKNILVATTQPQSIDTVHMACEMAKLHNATVKAVHFIEVPYSMPLDSKMLSELVVAGDVLRRSEAIAREFNVHIDEQVMRSRNVSEAILALLSEEKFDLVVLEATTNGQTKLNDIADKVLRSAPCRVWVCSGTR